MIYDAWFWTGAVICILSFVICVIMTIIRTFPDDASIISVGAVELFLVVYSIAALVRSTTSAPIAGPLWEFWGYILTALMLPVIAFVWAVTDKTRWSNLVLGAIGPTVLVMIQRIQVIWFG